jgi:hypothetical protein
MERGLSTSGTANTLQHSVHEPQVRPGTIFDSNGAAFGLTAITKFIR